MSTSKVAPRPASVDQLAAVLDCPEVARLIKGIEYMRWTGRPGYPIRAMVGMCLVKALYALPTWTRVCRLVAEHDGLQRVLGAVPSQWACYRFARQLRARDLPWLEQCITDVLAGLKDQHPDMGRDIAVDGSDLPAYSNGHRAEDKRKDATYSDPDASWGHRSAISTRKGGGFFGYKLHAAVDVATGLPLEWTVRSAKDSEHNFARLLIGRTQDRGYAVQTAIMDKGYDGDPLQQWCMSRGVTPIVALKDTERVQKGAAEPPQCIHGDWTYAGTDYQRKATKWRCPTGECKPASMWVKADRLHPLIPRESKRFKDLYRRRGAVEREFGRLKHEWALLPLRIRGLERVRLHADLTILAKLATRLASDRLLQVG